MTVVSKTDVFSSLVKAREAAVCDEEVSDAPSIVLETGSRWTSIREERGEDHCTSLFALATSLSDSSGSMLIAVCE